MTDSDLYTYWLIGLGITALVVVIVVVLLLWILMLARRIAANATRALRAAEKIKANTQVIWELQTTNEVAAQLLEGARSIRQHADEVADTLENHANPAALV